ncbi:MAG: CBS domain-containing protein [Myxococcota bacterium]
MSSASSRRGVTIREVMTSHVRTARPEQNLQEIWRMLTDERCHHIPIVDAGRPIGMVSTRDLVRVARKHGAEKLSAGLYGGETAADVMTRALETIYADEPVESAIDRIGIGEFHALVVLDDDENLVGIVTHHDLLHYLAD